MSFIFVNKINNIEKRVENLEKLFEKMINNSDKKLIKSDEKATPTISEKVQKNTNKQQNWNVVVDEWLNGNNK